MAHARRLLKNYLFIFRERGGRKKERERNIDRLSLVHIPTRTEPATQARALTGNQTRDLLLCRMTLNPLSHTGQGWKGFEAIRRQRIRLKLS